MASWRKQIAGRLRRGVGVNPVRSGVSREAAFLTALFLKLRGAELGPDVRISPLCRVFGAGSVVVGQGSEILRFSTLDGAPGERRKITLGAWCRLKENVWLAAYGGQIDIGDRVLIGRNSVIHGHGGVSIGSHSMFGPGCMVFSNDHLVAPGKIFQELGHTCLPTRIGENVWVGAGVIVTGGSVIEEETVVAAGSVVHGHLERGFLYSGAPARRLKSVAEMAPADGVRVQKWSLS